MVDKAKPTHEQPRQQPLRCARCGNGLTRDSGAIEIDGAHVFEARNPEERHFRIACYEAAPGARPIGIPSGHWTWFPDYMWQRLWCNRCEQHVGWHFEKRDHSFVVIDLGQVQAPSPPDPAMDDPSSPAAR
jgi:hypothetical protein